jgi:Zn-dependent protease/CBS domain-containing protein
MLATTVRMGKGYTAMASTGMRLGRLFGIELRLDRSWFIAFFLISWLLAANQLPNAYPHWTPVAYWWIGLMASALLFVSVMAHELGHAFVATRLGIPVRDITLFIFGGAARLSREPRRARDELLIALAGPAVSLLLALGFAGLWIVSSGVAEPYLALFGWLAAANAILGVFNLIPGFPMDGGRVVRAVLWGVTGNQRRATQTAANMGRLIAYMFIAWGLLQMLNGNLVGGIWMALIGAFLNGSAAQAYRQAGLSSLPAGILARDLMIQLPPVHPWDTLDTVVEKMIQPDGRRCVPVVEGREWLGLLTLTAIGLVPRHAWPVTRAMHVMQGPEKVLTVAPTDILGPVVERMVNEGISYGAVVEAGELMGVLDLETIMTTLRLRDEVRAGGRDTSADSPPRTPDRTAKIA